MGELNKKCVVLYSGGLDSLLAVYIMKSLNFSVYPLFVKTPFYKKDEDRLKSQIENLSLKLYITENSGDYIEVVKNPEFGYGKNLNPCIDCKIFFFKQAKLFMEKIGAGFIVTGEVLGQRPMSQRSYSVLRAIEKRANLIDLILRPLSAKCLPQTQMEKEGIIDREKLFCITGRSRKEQFKLAKEFGIDSFESPAGGCLLTDAAFSKRVKELLKNEQIDKYELELLTIGRHFKINKKRFVVSRNREETLLLFDSFKDKLPFLRCYKAAGAAGVFVETPEKEELSTAAAILKRYSKKANEIEYIYKNSSVIIKPEEISQNMIDSLKAVQKTQKTEGEKI